MPENLIVRTPSAYDYHLLIKNLLFLRNPFYLDSKSGIDWTLNPV